MTPLPYVWPYALVFWAVFFWAFLPEFAIVRRAQRERTATDARSLQVIMMGMRLSLVAAIPLASVTALQFHTHRVAVFGLGMTLLISGSLLRRHCWRMLGTSFTGDVRASAEQAVVTRGAYAFLRHPSYTAGILMNTGIGVAFGSWGSALLLALAALLVYTYRITVEERALVAAIGDPYRDFMRTRKRLIPFVY